MLPCAQFRQQLEAAARSGRSSPKMAKLLEVLRQHFQVRGVGGGWGEAEPGWGVGGGGAAQQPQGRCWSVHQWQMCCTHLHASACVEGPSRHVVIFTDCPPLLPACCSAVNKQDSAGQEGARGRAVIFLTTARPLLAHSHPLPPTHPPTAGQRWCGGRQRAGHHLHKLSGGGAVHRGGLRPPPAPHLRTVGGCAGLFHASWVGGRAAWLLLVVWLQGAAGMLAAGQAVKGTSCPAMNDRHCVLQSPPCRMFIGQGGSGKDKAAGMTQARLAACAAHACP